MEKLIHAVQRIATDTDATPFSKINVKSTQRVLNLPVCKPTLMATLQGQNVLGRDGLVVPERSYVLLARSTIPDTQYIPSEHGFLALSIWFEAEDFLHLRAGLRPRSEGPHLMGPIDDALATLLLQFVEWAQCAPSSMWPSRRREILEYLQTVSQVDLSGFASAQTIAAQVFGLVSTDLSEAIELETICRQLAMSESTLRRRLKAEGTTLQVIRDRARLGYGLKLVQTTSLRVAEIAIRCGYQSQSRFTERFKRLFGVTPTELRRSQTDDRERGPRS